MVNIIKKKSKILFLLFVLFIIYGCANKDVKESRVKTIQVSESDTSSSSEQKSDYVVSRGSDGTYWNVDDLSNILDDTTITTLRLWRGSFADLTPLKKLTNLEMLTIEKNRNIKDITPISALKKLNVLSLFGCENITNLKPLAELQNIHELDLTESCMKQVTLIELVNLKNLETFSMNIGNIITLENIAKISSLKKVAIEISHVTDNSIIKLQNLNMLQDLTLWGLRNSEFITDPDKLSIMNLDWIKPCVNLESLNLWGFFVLDVSPLNNLTKLTSVNVDGCFLGDLTPLLESESINVIGYDSRFMFVGDEIIQLFAKKGIDVVDMRPDH